MKDNKNKFIFLNIAKINFSIEENFQPQHGNDFFKLFKANSKNKCDVRIKIKKFIICPRKLENHKTIHLNNFQKLKVRIHQKIRKFGLFTLEADTHRILLRDFSNHKLEFSMAHYLKKSEKEYDNSQSFYFQVNYRDLVSTFFPCFSAIMLHGSGIIRQGRSAIFLAHSGGGKSTAIDLSSNCPILNDDQVVLRKKGDKIYAFGTPFGKRTSGQVSAKLGGFFLLEKSKKFNLVKIEPQEVLKYLWSTLPDQTFFLPHHLKIRVIDILNKASREVPCYKLYFQKDFIDWKEIDKVLAK
jgi:hypothetical protein